MHKKTIMKPAILCVDLKLKRTITIFTIITKRIVTTYMLRSQYAKLALNFLSSYLSLLGAGIPGTYHPTSTFTGFIFEDEKLRIRKNELLNFYHVI